MAGSVASMAGMSGAVEVMVWLDVSDLQADALSSGCIGMFWIGVGMLDTILVDRLQLEHPSGTRSPTSCAPTYLVLLKRCIASWGGASAWSSVVVRSRISWKRIGMSAAMVGAGIIVGVGLGACCVMALIWSALTPWLRELLGCWAPPSL